MDNTRDYAAVPHEYLEEMAALNDGEFGRLVRALLEYSKAGTPIALSGNERFYAVRVMNREDRYQKSYIDANEKRSAAGKAGADARWNSQNANACDRIRSDAKACDAMRSDGKNGNTETKTKTETKTETETKVPTGENALAPAKPPMHKFGEYGWVRLTDAQYEKLVADFGQQEADRCIAYVDESAQRTSNKNGWKDWNLTVRKCHRENWGQQYQARRPENGVDLDARYDMMRRWADGQG